ncbi:hypothetical protein ELG83_08100 [Rhizobium leguminosarum]|uniref:Uncharacterized protein n=1 Tax=Rhizobium leguminosarum bv. viciae TaxID=387 RepID=A0A8G2MU11_RHILV|nr:hypothetical protein [Rhizobium leguminosarum]NKK05930.1 hypothetical protein [Rhizobium leguminosarum bv. viciae]NEH74017.1 hypothetical protein [Rhizobium leguminosarum]NEI95291.1 hypothetical protein [Rhizobium leguminosarum]NEJ81725.1 hypothetical protein [Rhizobium leguminosarum]
MFQILSARFPESAIGICTSILSFAHRLLSNSFNRNRFKDEIMQQFKMLQRPLRLSKRRAAL